MMKKPVALILCLVFLLGVSSGVIAAANQQEIKALINYNLKMKLNGNDFAPLGSDGQVMRPITYKGTSYLPVRAIAEALDIAVDYDSATQTIYLGEKGRIPVAGTDFKKNYTCQFSVDTSQLFVNNQQYQWGIVYTGTDGNYEYSCFVCPNGEYQKFGGTACFQDLDNSTEEVIIKIRDTDYQGTVLKEITLKKGDSTAFEIDIPGVKTLYIQNLVSDRVPKSSNPDRLVIAEPYFK